MSAALLLKVHQPALFSQDPFSFEAATVKFKALRELRKDSNTIQIFYVRSPSTTNRIFNSIGTATQIGNDDRVLPATAVEDDLIDCLMFEQVYIPYMFVDCMGRTDKFKPTSTGDARLKNALLNGSSKT